MTIGSGDPEAMHLRDSLSPGRTRPPASGKEVATRLGTDSPAPLVSAGAGAVSGERDAIRLPLQFRILAC